MKKTIHRSFCVAPYGISKQILERKGFLKCEIQKIDPNFMWLFKEIQTPIDQKHETLQIHLGGLVPLSNYEVYSDENTTNHYSCVIKYSSNNVKKLARMGVRFLPLSTKDFYLIYSISENNLKDVISKNKLQQISDIDNNIILVE